MSRNSASKALNGSYNWFWYFQGFNRNQSGLEDKVNIQITYKNKGKSVGE